MSCIAIFVKVSPGVIIQRDHIHVNHCLNLTSGGSLMKKENLYMSIQVENNQPPSPKTKKKPPALNIYII